MTAFKELLIGGYVLRFWPSDNGWMCGITPQMMDALQQQRTWVGLTDEEIVELHHEIKVQLMGTYKTEDIYRAIEAKLRSKNHD
jgi:hypothetical protein